MLVDSVCPELTELTDNLTLQRTWSSDLTETVTSILTP